MDTDMTHQCITAQASNLAGWTCGVCGVWVPVGATHYCTTPSTYGRVAGASLPDQTDRLIGAIDRLIAAIERLEKRLP